MERKGKKELLMHIEEQNQNLQKYQTRLSDVVKSYKSLAKEKEALENSVRALTEGSKNDSPKLNEEKDSVATTLDKPDDHNTNYFECLKQSLRTLTEEKIRIENELKSDRKRILAEKDELVKKLADKETQWTEDKKVFEITSKDLKRKLRDLQREREKDQQEHGLMLKELQSLVADERAAKERLEQHIENLKMSLEKMPDKRFEYEKQVLELQNELTSVKQLLHEAEGEKKGLPSLLKQLQQEMQEMKEQHQLTVEEESLRANDAEDKLKNLASVSEGRAANLESRLSELSQMVGNYDKLRQQDQFAIQKLKDRVAQLDQENSALAGTIAGNENYSNLEDDTKLDVQTLIERINKLKGYLRIARQNSNKNIGKIDVQNEITKDCDSDVTHSSCQKEIQRLKEELVNYKQRVQANEKKIAGGAESISEINALKSQLTLLQEDLLMYKLQLESGEKCFAKTEETMQNCIKEMKLKHQKEMNIQSSEFKLKIMELEQLLQKQRERSLKLLEDKDKDIDVLKSKFKTLTKDDDSLTTRGRLKSSQSDEFGEDSVSNSLTTCRKDSHLLHFTQEMARKEVEIANLRKTRSQAETALRELQQIRLLKEERYQDEIDELTSKIRRLESIQKGVNLEYLKNVILRFIKCKDANDQTHMLNAIAAILHFTPHELSDLKVL